MQFALRTAGLILFGRGQSQRLPQLVAPWGQRLLLVTGGESLERSGRLQVLLAGLAECGVQVTRVQVRGEPELHIVETATQLCREAACQGVLAVGGGSVLDVGKAVAALATHPGRAIEYLEDVGLGQPRELTMPSLPVCAVPTTAGSGSEVTRNSVLRVPELAVKRSMRSDFMLPRVAVVDPDLSATAPLRVAAAAGLDALTHLLEGYVSRGAQPTTDALALSGLRVMVRALSDLAAAQRPSAAAAEPGTREVAEKLALGSLWGGMVLANAGLGAVHGLVAPLGGLCSVAHGDGCACLLPATFAANIRALQARAPQSPALLRYSEVAALLCPAGAADFEAAAARLQALRRDLQVPSLAEQGVTSQHIAPIIAQSRGSSMRNNPIELRDQELEEILTASLV